MKKLVLYLVYVKTSLACGLWNEIRLRVNGSCHKMNEKNVKTKRKEVENEYQFFSFYYYSILFNKMINNNNNLYLELLI
jgi:hypothetical protein